MKSRVPELVIVLFLVLFFAVVAPAPIQLAALILVGWVQFILRVVPQMKVNLSALLSAIICFAGILILGQVLGRYLMLQISAVGGEVRRWRLRWTFLAAGVIIVSFAAGTAAVGVAHQSAWLVRSDEPWFEYRRPQQVYCRAHLRTVWQAIQLYAADHSGRLPDDLSQLANEDMEARYFFCPTHGERDVSTTPYVYHGRGLKLPLRPSMVLAAEPLNYHKGLGMNVLFASGEVEFLSPLEADRVMRVGANSGEGL